MSQHPPPPSLRLTAGSGFPCLSPPEEVAPYQLQYSSLTLPCDARICTPELRRTDISSCSPFLHFLKFSVGSKGACRSKPTRELYSSALLNVPYRINAIYKFTVSHCTNESHVRYS